MTIKELKVWVNSLPDSYMNFQIMQAELGELNDDDEYEYNKKMPIIATTVVKYTEEAVFIRDTRKRAKTYKYGKYETNPTHDEQLDN